MEQIYDMIVIGGGPGGYTAALYAVRSGLRTLVVEKRAAGGQMALTSRIDNYPGFPDGADGFSLGEQMRRQAERFGAQTLNDEVLGADLTVFPKLVNTDSGSFRGRTVVIATGAEPRRLDVPGGEQVHYCAACDGMFFRGKTVAVVGGGNSAAAEALLLSRVAEQVILIHRRDTLRAAKLNQQALEQTPNIGIRWDSAVTGVLGSDPVTGVRLRNLRSGEETVLPCDGVFVSIGREPVTEFLAGQVTLEAGYIRADETTRTSLPGVFAVGDVRTKPVRQIVTATADGAAAAHFAQIFLTDNA